jgi:hypothetical protein
VYNAPAVRECECIEYLLNETDCARCVDCSLKHAGVEGRSLNVFHDHQNLIVGAKGGSEGGDTGMFKSGDDFDFAQKAFNQIGAGIRARKQNFHGLNAIRKKVTNLENLPHPAAADDRNDLVISDGRADFEDGWACGHQRTVYGDWGCDLP